MEGSVNFQPSRGPRHDLTFHGDDAETDLVSPESPDDLVIKSVRLRSTEMSPPLQERMEACPLGDAGPIRAWVNDPDRMLVGHDFQGSQRSLQIEQSFGRMQR